MSDRMPSDELLALLRRWGTPIPLDEDEWAAFERDVFDPLTKPTPSIIAGQELLRKLYKKKEPGR